MHKKYLISHDFLLRLLSRLNAQLSQKILPYASMLTMDYQDLTCNHIHRFSSISNGIFAIQVNGSCKSLSQKV